MGEMFLRWDVLLEGGSEAFQPCRKTSQLCRERQQQHPQQKQDPDVSRPQGTEGLVPTKASDWLLKCWS